MIASKVPTQAEVDAALLDRFGLKPTGVFTSDKSHQLYVSDDNKAFTLPASNQGYSWYMVDDILAHVQAMESGAKTVGIHHYVAKPDLKLIESEDK